eukprot:9137917-Ditylum_brightwellii.AAC.1
MVMLQQPQENQREEDKESRDHQLNLVCMDMEQQDRAREAREANCDHCHSNMMMMMMMGSNITTKYLPYYTPCLNHQDSPHLNRIPTPCLNCQYTPQMPPRKVQSKVAHVIPPVLAFVTQPPVTLGRDNGDESSQSTETLIAKETVPENENLISNLVNYLPSP